jgi:hypothetical protein
MRTISVNSMAGEPILELAENMMGSCVDDVLAKVPGHGMFDKLLVNHVEVDDVLLETLLECAKLDVEVVLTHIRQEPWLLCPNLGLNPVQDSLLEFADMPQCLSLASLATRESCIFKCIRGFEAINHVMLLPPRHQSGRILAKCMQSESAYEYDIDFHESTTRWQIAEGSYNIRGGIFQVEWAALAQFSADAESFESGSSDRSGPWRRHELPQETCQLTDIPVFRLTPSNVMRLEQLIETWAKEEEENDYKGMKGSKSKCEPVQDGAAMPGLSADLLKHLGFAPEHLEFWTAGSARDPSHGPSFAATRDEQPPTESGRLDHGS